MACGDIDSCVLIMRNQKNKEECLMADDKHYDKSTDKNDSGEIPARDSRLMEDTEFWRLNVKALEGGKFERI